MQNTPTLSFTNIESLLVGIPKIDLIYKAGSAVNIDLKITCSNDCVAVLRESWDENKIEFIEQFKILLLNRANNVLGVFEVSTGGVTATVVDIKLIFAAAILANASGIILAHNHPSGNLQASTADRMVTRKLIETGDILDIKVLDHIILTRTGYYSFADDGEM
ncbi:JAB domain-containing protein (plasmid) [Adhaeribacter swui]|uniref:JAB domain-containing protein n=2 Tax=Adhaeribacter swui TaxID=2086471 RepID=A0A7G7G2M3_9BACT|nr:JAB domain-containing protein [Adhaeribacter swui]